MDRSKSDRFHGSLTEIEKAMNIKNPKIKFKFIFVAFMLWRFLLNIQFVNINLVIPKRFFLVAIGIGFIDKSQSMMTNPRHIIDIIV